MLWFRWIFVEKRGVRFLRHLGQDGRSFRSENVAIRDRYEMSKSWYERQAQRLSPNTEQDAESGLYVPWYPPDQERYDERIFRSTRLSTKPQLVSKSMTINPQVIKVLSNPWDWWTRDILTEIIIRYVRRSSLSERFEMRIIPAVLACLTQTFVSHKQRKSGRYREAFSSKKRRCMWRKIPSTKKV